jgi:hypothetical protein
MLALVAPSSMTAEQQEMWLRAAVDSLEDIRADEVAHVSAEVRRSVTRHNQIVPEIAKLVAERRKRNSETARYAALPKLPPKPDEKPVFRPFTRKELDEMPKWIRDVGLRCGFLKLENGRLIEIPLSEAVRAA